MRYGGNLKVIIGPSKISTGQLTSIFFGWHDGEIVNIGAISLNNAVDHKYH